MPTANALPGRTHCQGGDQPGRQAHKLEETLYTSTKQDEKIMLYFVGMTHGVAEIVLFRQYVPVALLLLWILLVLGALYC